MFSYGSGCCSEFYSGAVTASGQERQRRFAIGHHLDNRHHLSMDEYDTLLRDSAAVRFGTRNTDLDDAWTAAASLPGADRPRLYLRRIKEFHREYEWTQ